MRVVEKADTGVLTPNADFPKTDEPSCDVAPKAGAAGFAGVETGVVGPNALTVGALGFANGEFIKEELPKADVPTPNVVEPNAEGVDLRPPNAPNPESGLSGDEAGVVDAVPLPKGLEGTCTCV